MASYNVGNINSVPLESLRDISIWLGVIACIASLNPWIAWPSSNIILLLVLLFCVSRIPFCKSRVSYGNLFIVSGVVLFGFILCQLFIIPIMASIFQALNTFLPIIVFLGFDKSEKEIFLQRLINVFAIVLAISIIWFLLHFFIELPYFIFKHNSDFYPPFKNYIFFVVGETEDLGWLTRFNSVYTEPGHLAMACAIFLYIYGYTWKKWQNIAMTIGLVWSFSLAGFLLYVIGLVLQTLAKSKNIGKSMLNMVVSLVVLVGIGLAYYSPTNDDIVSVKILSRLEFDENKGLSGNNRNSLVFDQFYEKITNSDNKYLGIGKNELNRRYGGTGNSSYKNFIIGSGYVGIACIWGLMTVILIVFPSKRGFGLMLLLCASFIQRPYFLWLIQVIPYIAALSQWEITDKNPITKKVMI